jgi:hypothetical protein
MTNLRNKILNIILLLTLVFGSFQLYEAEGQTRSQAADALFSKNDSSSRVRVLEMVSRPVEVKVVSNNQPSCENIFNQQTSRKDESYTLFTQPLNLNQLPECGGGLVVVGTQKSAAMPLRVTSSVPTQDSLRVASQEKKYLQFQVSGKSMVAVKYLLPGREGVDFRVKAMEGEALLLGLANDLNKSDFVKLGQSVSGEVFDLRC